MRNLILATSLLVLPASALAGGPTCAISPSPMEMAAIRTAENQADVTVGLPAPVNPQGLTAKVDSKAPRPKTISPSLGTREDAPHLPAPAMASTAVSAQNVSARAADTLQPLSANTIASVPALKRIASAGASLADLGAEHGLRTIFARKGNAFQVFYLVPDGSAAIGGIMWDASGHDLTRDQVAPIPGVIPTVKVGPEAGETTAEPAADRDQHLDPLSLAQQTTYGTTGSPDAPELWMFIDPFCAFSVRAMQQLEPYVEAGKVRLSVIPLSVLDYEDQGRSTPAATIMVGEPKNKMVADWVSGGLTGTPPAGATALLGRNMAIAGGLHLRGTPTFIWRNSDGTAGRADGIPPDLNTMIALIGK